MAVNFLLQKTSRSNFMVCLLHNFLNVHKCIILVEEKQEEKEMQGRKFFQDRNADGLLFIRCYSKG